MKMNKSIYKSFIDCKLKAYYEKNKTPKTNENETYMVFYNYAKLKELGMNYMASRYHFVDISNLKGVKYFNDKINETMKYIQKPGYNCICNAAFQNGPIQGQIDFLVKAPDGMRWSPVIVKASEDIKENIGVDCGFVKALLRDKVEIDKIYILSVNKSFIKHGKISDVRNLITITSKFDGKDLVDYADNFPVDFGACEMFLENPTKPVFKGCKNCKYCEWRDRCIKDGNLPEYGTLDIIYGKDTAYKYFAEGKKLIKDVPYDEDFDLRQTAQIYCEKNPDKIIFEPKKIKSFLKGLKEPYHFMDFEALNTLVPRVDGTRPFEFVPYQYSLHQTKSDLKVYNYDEFLSFDMDCRKEFLDRLLTSLGTEGSIIVWNVEFEQTRLNELAEQFPEYRKRIEALEDRYFDLMIPFDKLWFYKPEMYGKYSLKYVFPALSDVKSYNDLNVKNGLQTMILYFKILKGEVNPDEVRQAMLDYCSLDTESMIYILDEMKKAIKTLTPDKYVTLTQMNKEVKEEQLNRRFKTSKIPAICSNIVHDLVADIPDDKIDEDGALRYYKVSVLDSYKLESDLQEEGVSGQTLPPPPTPNIRQGVVQNRSALIAWDKIADTRVQYYVVYRQGGGYGESNRFSDITNTQFVDNSMKEGITYTYYVVSVDKLGIESIPSQKITLTLQMAKETQIQQDFKSTIDNSKDSQ